MNSFGRKSIPGLEPKYKDRDGRFKNMGPEQYKLNQDYHYGKRKEIGSLDRQGRPLKMTALS